MELGRVVLVGDEGAGKTSLAHALAGAALPDVLPRVVDPLPAPVAARDAWAVRRCPVLARAAASDAPPPPPPRLTIVDTAPESAAAALHGAAVVCVVCDCSAPRAAVLDALAARWLPLAAHAAPHAAVLVVFAKMDRVRGAAAAADLRAALDGVLAAHAAVCAGHACSTAAAGCGIDALRARAAAEALAPLAPLYDAAARAPTPALAHALARVFALLDADGDGVLGPAERAHLARLTHAHAHSPAPHADPVDAAAFARLVAQMLRRLRHAAVWRLLRRAGYAADLSLAVPPDDEHSNEGALADAQFELTDAARAFLGAVHAACVAGHSRAAARARLDTLLAARVPALAAALDAAPEPLGAADLVGAVQALCRRAPQTAATALWLLGYGFAADAPDAGVRPCRPAPAPASPLPVVPHGVPALAPAPWQRLCARVRTWLGSTRFWALVATVVAAAVVPRALGSLLRVTPPQQRQQAQTRSRHVALPLFPREGARPLPWYMRVRRFFS